MTPDTKAGRQLTGAELHQQQQKNKKDGPVVVAVGLKDVFNLGNILRSSEAIGVSHVYFVDILSMNETKLRRTSRNASNLVDHTFLSSYEFAQISPSLPPLIALEITDRSTDIFTTNYQRDVGFVVGAEDGGIPQEILDICQLAVHLPMVGIITSLNVATTLNTALYDWHRRFRYQ